MYVCRSNIYLASNRSSIDSTQSQSLLLPHQGTSTANHSTLLANTEKCRHSLDSGQSQSQQGSSTVNQAISSANTEKCKHSWWRFKLGFKWCVPKTFQNRIHYGNEHKTLNSIVEVWPSACQWVNKMEDLLHDTEVKISYPCVQL
jgi:hypothetical protein